MNLSEQIYAKCSHNLESEPGSATRSGGAFIPEPLIWESILLSVHFLCVLHAVHEREPFRRLAELWRARRAKKAKIETADPLRAETDQAFQELENQLQNQVIQPLYDQIETAKTAVHKILSSYDRAAMLPPATAEQIVSAVVDTVRAKSERQDP